MRRWEPPAGVSVSCEESAEFVTLVWTGAQGAKIANPPGIVHSHVTRCVAGRVRFRFRDDDSESVLSAGQETILPVARGYVVTVEEACEVRCFYPKAVPGAVAEIDHLRQTTDGGTS